MDEHHQNTNHPMNKNNFTILSAHNNNISLRLLEFLYIHKHKPKLNLFSPVDLKLIN